MAKHIPTHFSEILRDHFHDRALKNPAYSLRAFARDLGLTPSGLSQIMKKKTGISPQKAVLISRKLGLKKNDAEFFCALVQANCARRRNDRTAAEARLWQYDTSYTNIQDDYFRIVADWHHFAILELTRVKGFRSDADWIAERLGISADEARNAIQRLLSVRLLKPVNGILHPTYDYLVVPGGTPLAAAKKFHEQICLKAAQAIHAQKIEDRDYSAGFVPVRTSDLPKIAARIKKFRRELAKEIESGEGHDSIYAFAIQFFRGDHAST